MGKHGPCCHCGVTSTPLWRNGPPEKPVLCNACGSRWRTKGTLTNYTPLHARAEPDDLVDYRAAKGKTISIKHREANFLKRKYDNHVTDYAMVPPQYNDGYRRAFDEDISNRSSSGSAISNSESCAQYGTAEASDLTGPTQPIIWDSTVPSRKRTCVTRPKPSPVEKLTKDLYTIWHEQSSCLSVSTEDDLLPVTEEPLGSVEFGHGSVLIRQPSSIAREEESEASSLPVDHKHRAVSSQRMIFPCVKEETGVNSSIREIKKPTSEGVDRARREEDQREKLQTLVLHSSPLCRIDLQEIVNFDQFTNLFTNDEKKNLLKFLPAVDIADPFLRGDEKHSLQKFLPAVETAETSLRLKSLFDSPQFKENLLSFQKVLGDGVLDGSLSGITKDECKMLKKLLLCIPLKSKWVEQYQNFKESKVKTGVDESEVVRVFNSIPTNYSATKKRSQDGQPQKLAGAKVGMKNPKRILMKPNYEQKELLDNDENLLSAKRALSSHTNNGSLVLDSSHLMEDSSEQDLLIELPSHSSFPQAELLLPIPTTSFGAQASSSSSVYTNAMRR